MSRDIHQTMARSGDAARVEWTATASHIGISGKAEAVDASAGFLHECIVGCG
jgi:hypothetical protein